MTYPRKIQIVNCSDVLTDAQVYSFTQALDKDLRNNFNPAWGLWAIAEFVSVKAHPSVPSVPLDPSKYPIYIVDTPTTNGAWGQHMHTAGGESYALVWYGSCGGAWPRVAGHEAKEMLVNPLDNLAGCGWALEPCDPVEGQVYSVGGWPMENFVYPSWFSTEGAAPYDQIGMISAPLTPQPGGRMPS